MIKNITPYRIGSTASVKKSDNIYEDGYFKLVFFEDESNNNAVVINLDKKHLEKVFRRCLMTMLYDDIEYQSLINEEIEEYNNSVFGGKK